MRVQRPKPIIVRCGSAEHVVSITVRDIQLVDEPHFFGHDGFAYRRMLGLDYIEEFPDTHPPDDESFGKQSRRLMLALAKQLLHKLEDQRDLVSYDLPVQGGRGSELSVRQLGEARWFKGASPADCRSAGCGDGSWCSCCWGKPACIPNGALC
jgi:hypothetical protein